MNLVALLWTIAARGSAITFQFANGVIIARYLGPTDLGRYYYVFTAAMVGMQLTQLGLHVSNTYFYSKRPELLSNLLGNLLYLTATIGVATGLGVYAIEYSLAREDAIQAPIILAIALCPLLLLVVSLNTLSVAISQRIFNMLTILQGAATLCATLAVSLFAPTAAGFLVGYAAGLGLTAIIAIFAVKKGQKISLRFHWPLFLETISYGVRAHILAFAGFVGIRVSIFVIRIYGGITDIGYWSIASQMADAMQVIPSIVGTVLFPFLIRTSAEHRWHQTIKTAVGLTSLMLFGCICLAIVANPLITTVFGAKYEQSTPILLALLPGVIFLAAMTSASQLLSASGVPLGQMIAWVTMISAQSAAAFVVYPRWGTEGLAILQSVTFGVICIWLWVLAIKGHRRNAVSSFSSS
ncbi:O-antigen/teichoic acid export membrane protein [Nitrobacteraceae bacterium AZCC 1564]